MAQLVWDKVGDRFYETGLDRGVLYLSDGSAVPWNGLTSIIEKFDKERSSVYFDGMKIQDLVTLGDFSATMRAVTYPDEFIELEGLAPIRNGAFMNDQPPKMFSLCYRTKIGDDVEGDSLGYKLHILYNLTAIPHEKTYATLSSDPSLVEFEWDISAVPEEIVGYRPSAHITLDSRDFDPWLLEDLEAILYGNDESQADLLSMSDLYDFIKDWGRIRIVDNGDDTWTAISERNNVIVLSGIDEELFTLTDANVIYHEDDIFIISDTYDISDIPLINIVNNGDGTWTATTAHDGLFTEIDGLFQILNANAIVIGPDKYALSNTEEDG